MDRKYDRSVGLACLFYLPGLFLIGGGVFYPFWKLVSGRVRSPLWVAGVFSENPYLVHVLTFTLQQALVSAAVSTALALPLAAFFRFYGFRGKKVLLAMSRLVFALPAVVVAFAFILIYGNHGLINQALALCGLHVDFLYRAEAIICAHVYFNVFYGVCVLREQWLLVPERLYRSAVLLDLGPVRSFWCCDWPYLRYPLIRFFLQTFLLCLGSYAIPLLLGGGPAYSTLELAIFQALRVEFSVDSAVAIAVVQLLVSGSVALICLKIADSGPRPELKSGRLRTGADKKPGAAGKLLIFLYGIFLVLPLAGVLSEGVVPTGEGASFPGTELVHYMLKGTGYSLGWGGLSSATAVALALSVALAQWHISYRFPIMNRVGELLFQLLLGFSPMVLSLGMFMSWRKEFHEVFTPSAGIVVVFTLLAVPYCWWQIFPALKLIRQNTWARKSLLDLGAWQAFVYVDLPALKRPLAASFLTGMALALGNFSVVSLFAPEGMHTLASGVSDLMSVYRFRDAGLLAALLALLAFFLFFLSDRYLSGEVSS